MTDFSMPVPVARIVPNPNQPRKEFNQETLQELADSILENGLLQPVNVEDAGDGTYILVSGERRWRAVQLLGWNNIPAIVRERSNHNGRELLLHAVAENIQRENMNPIDEAEACQRMHDEFDMSWTEIGRKTGKNSGHITQLTILLKLDPEIRGLVRADKLTHMYNVAQALLNIPNRDARIALARKIATNKLTNKAAVIAAEKVAQLYASERLQLGDAGSPAMKLAQVRHPGISKSSAPSGWNALVQMGKVPEWSGVTQAITKTCGACTLAPMASKATCGECPLVDYLNRLVANARA